MEKKCTNRRVYFLVHLYYESTLLCVYYLICPAVELTELYIYIYIYRNHGTERFILKPHHVVLNGIYLCTAAATVCFNMSSGIHSILTSFCPCLSLPKI